MAARTRRMAMLAAVLAACAAGVALSSVGFGIPCVFHLVTGLDCPSCGVTRMLGALARCDLAAAFRANAALTMLLPVLAVLAVRLVPRWLQTGSLRIRRAETAVVWCCIAALLLFGVVRNLPIYPY